MRRLSKTRKNLILTVILSATLIAAIVFHFAGKQVSPVIILGGLVAFIVFGAYTPPQKHKSFGYRDQQRAMRAFDRTELLDFQIGTKAKKKKKRKTVQLP